MAKTDDEDRKELQERRELLKMKQGLIEESDLIPETGYDKIPELHGWEKIKNNIYHNKVFYIIGILAAALVIFLIVQAASVEREDVHVLLIQTEPDTEMGLNVSGVEIALEQYCPDFDNNGYVHVGVDYINVSSDANGEYYMAQLEKLSTELYDSTGQLFVTDKGIWGRVGDTTRFGSKTFVDFTDKYKDDDRLYYKTAISANKTGFAQAANWSDCPDDILILVRNELSDGAKTNKEITEQRERALTIVDNIMNDNVVNPKTTGE